jgi:hypothetical protein
MSIGQLSEDEFAKILHTHLSPSSPIQSYEHLHGRQSQLREIEESLYAPGRHIFIYGDRGVGKTSLAQTAAFAHQSSDNEPIIRSCDEYTTFFQLIKSIVEEILNNPLREKRITTYKGGFSIKGVSLETQKSIESGSIPEIKDINTAVSLVKYLSEQYSDKTLVVIDEFDLVKSIKEKKHFADFIKQLGDQRIKIQFIFCGIGQSLDELLGAHGSCHRYLSSIDLPRLNYTARFEIVGSAAKALGIEIDEYPFEFRIAAISDGFPHYVHLVCEKLFWAMFNDPKPVKKVASVHYTEAIRAAVRGIQMQLKKAYEYAIMQKTDDFEEVLWAVADHSDLIRHTRDIYNSYCRIVEERHVPQLTKQKVSSRLSKWVYA